MVSVMLYPCMLCICQYSQYVWVCAILLLNVMELLCVVGGALLDRPCMVFHIMCVLCLSSQ